MAAELASGYVSLTVRYSDSMKKLNQDFAKVSSTAKTTGTKAGSEFAQGFNRQTAGASKQLNNSFRQVTGQAATAGKSSGNSFTQGFKSSTAGVGAHMKSLFAQGGQISQQAHQGGTKAGSNFAAGFAGFLKGAGIGAIGVAAAGIGTAITAGMGRLVAIDDAKAKLKGLGHTAAEVQQIMDNALASVKGTAFSLGDAATTAATAVAAGIKPGAELEAYLKRVGDAAAIANAPIGEMGSIFNKVTTNGKAMTDDLQMLADRGIPIFTWLQEKFKVTGSDLQKMVEDGKVSAADFGEAIQTHIGGAALKMGDSFSGGLANVKAAAGRFGAALLQPLFDKLPAMFDSLIPIIDKATTAIGPTLAKIGDGFKQHVLPVLQELWNQLKGPLGDTIKQWIATFKEWWPVIKMVGTVIGASLVVQLKAVGVVLPVVLRAMQIMQKVSQGVAQVVKAAWAVLEPIWEAWKRNLELVGTAATVFWQGVIVPAWEGIKGAFTTAWDVISPIFDKLKSAFKTAADFIGGVWNGVAGVIKSAFDGIIGAIKAPIHVMGNLLKSIPDLPGPLSIPGLGAVHDLGNTLAGFRKGGPVSGAGGTDNVLAWLTAGEGVVTKGAMQNGGAALVAALNAGWTPPVAMLKAMLPGFAKGGVADAINFAKSVGDGRAYVYGGVGPGYDCSGYMSSIYAAFTGKPQGTRYFTTESDFAALGFLPGNKPGAFNIGIKRGGGGKNSHMAGTLPDGTNVESGGAHGSTLAGAGAKGAAGFPLKFYLPVSGGDPTDAATASPGDLPSGGTGGGSGGGSGGGGGSDPFSKITAGIAELADLGVEGFKETFMPPGFSDPTQWASVKSLGGLLGFLGGLVGGFPGAGNDIAGGLLGTLGAGITGSGSGVVSGIASMIPKPFGTLENPAVTADQFANAGVAQGVGTGPLPGPGGVPAAPGAAGVDNSVHIGQVNDDAGTVLDKTQRQQASAQVPHLGTRRFV